jgi:MFS transporter, DHA1 family, inner membrane transport protein
VTNIRVVSVLSSAALFTVLTFLTPFLERIAGLTSHAAVLALFLFGAGLTVGGLIGGRFADQKSLLAIRVFLLLDAVVLLGFAVVAS